VLLGIAKVTVPFSNKRECLLLSFGDVSVLDFGHFNRCIVLLVFVPSLCCILPVLLELKH
jgi:hypothetical protein